MATRMKLTDDDKMFLALQEAVRAIGGYTAAGRACGCDRSTVFRWRKVPTKGGVVFKLAKASGVSIHLLRPDVYMESREALIEYLDNAS